MIDTLSFFEELSQTLDPPAAKKIAKLMGQMYTELSNMVTKEEFRELSATVKELAGNVKELSEAQKKTEQRVNELAEAQKKTEQRLNELSEAQSKTEQRLSELIEAQKKTEQRVNELAEALKKTEQKLGELAEAQKKTEQRLDELAEAQKKTEQEIAQLSRGLKITNERLGGLSRSVRYALENEAYRHLPAILKARYNIEVIDRLVRTYIQDEEINVFGKAKRDGKEAYIVGEAVLKLDDRSKLRQVWDKVSIVREEFGGEVIPIMVTHFAKPDVLERASKAGIIVIQSFEWV